MTYMIFKKHIRKILIVVSLTAMTFIVAAFGAVTSNTESYAETTPLSETPEAAVFLQPEPSPVAEHISPEEVSPELETEPEPEPEPEPDPIEAWPVWMYIPALDVDAAIQDTGTNAKGTSMEIAPSGSIISWWRVSSIPGNKGNAIFGSHNRWNGANGQLFSLDTLDVGDEMQILYDDGSSLTFRLESVFVYALATAPADIIMSLEGDARVTLITCKAPFNPNTGTSDNRIVATFKEESVFEIPDPPVTPFPARSLTP